MGSLFIGSQSFQSFVTCSEVMLAYINRESDALFEQYKKTTDEQAAAGPWASGLAVVKDVDALGLASAIESSVDNTDSSNVQASCFLAVPPISSSFYFYFICFSFFFFCLPIPRELKGGNFWGSRRALKVVSLSIAAPQSPNHGWCFCCSLPVSAVYVVFFFVLGRFAVSLFPMFESRRPCQELNDVCDALNRRVKLSVFSLLHCVLLFICQFSVHGWVCGEKDDFMSCR